MDIAIEKKNIVQWIQAIDDEKIIEKILSFKEKNEVLFFENQLIQKGLNDVSSGNVSSHEEVKKQLDIRIKNLEEGRTELRTWDEVKNHLKTIR